ncbi:MAG: hypothetical protein FJX53_16020, partial [Alphaproteobacteria bacterium]|nr:hypothetical protein [Alphaproteobacteria bacterium]
MTDTGRDAPAPLIARWHVGRIALQLAVVIVIVALVFIVPRITGETPVELPQDRQQELSEAQQEMERFGEDARWLADRNVLAAIIGCG